MNNTSALPEKDDNAATYFVGSDRYPMTIIYRDDKKIVARYDDYKPGPNHDYFGNQSYIYIENIQGEIKEFTLRKNGRWIPVGSDKDSGIGISLGHRRAYFDPSF